MAANKKLIALQKEVNLAWISITSITFFTVALLGKSASLDLMIIGMYTAHILYTLYVWRHLATFFNEDQE